MQSAYYTSMGTQVSIPGFHLTARVGVVPELGVGVGESSSVQRKS